MTRVSGPLRLVTDKPAQVAQVRVRAQHDRPEGGGLTTTFDDVVKTTGGQVDFTALPGPAIMLLESIGGFAHTVKLLIPDKAKASLQECVEGAEVLNVGDRDRLEKLAAEAMNAMAAARDAAASASAAKSSETSARSSASQAKTSASQASTSAANAKTSEQSAGTSASNAAASEKNAGASATSAKSDADRAANVANSTRWVGTKLEVNGKRSPDLMPKLEVSSRDTWIVNGTDTGKPARGPGGASAWEEVSGKPAKFPPEAHKHTVKDITDLPTPSTMNDPQTLAARDHLGNIAVGNALQVNDAANKRYVDNATKWANLTGKPSTFPPVSHQHEIGDVNNLAVAFGEGSKSASADGSASVAVGNNASAEKYGVAVGNGTTAGEWGVAIGDRAQAGKVGIALGYKAQATKGWHTVIGVDATDENIPTDTLRTVVIGIPGAPVYLAGVDVVTELNELKARIEKLEKR